MTEPLQTTLDGQTVPVRTRGGRCAAAAHCDPARLFEPVDVMEGQQALEVPGLEDSARCQDVTGTPS